MISLDTYRSGHFERSSGYQHFVPTPINDEWVWSNPEINLLIEKAAVKLGELNSFSRLVPNMDLFIQMHVAKEAVVSSRIEGIQTNIDEAFMPEAAIPVERKHDWKEVNNYIKALNIAVEELERLPVSSGLIRNAHAILLSGVRGAPKLPGEFRKSQNWIGGNTLNDAVFIPPHHQYIDQLMGDLENFLHNENIKTPALIRIAIAHYQFETIHPFLDGNGRVGRLLIPLYLVSHGILEKPLLYLSYFFEKNKGLYYDNLTRVRTHHDMHQWLRYFLAGIIEISTRGVDTLAQVIKLKEKGENDIRINAGRRANNAFTLLNRLFKNPIIDIQEVSSVCELTFKSASELVHLMEDLDILKESTGQQRSRIYLFDKYLNIFREI